MSDSEEIKYALDFRANRPKLPKNSAQRHSAATNFDHAPVPRIARLMALAIRLDGLLRAETFKDYAEIAQLGRVTRARMTQIIKLLNLAPDIQEQLLFFSEMKSLNERNLRPIVDLIDWNEQRPRFQRLVSVSRDQIAFSGSLRDHRSE